ncbi:MAG: hypothetical protein H0Z18_07245 [Thermococcus sp.]|uniref:PssD/Cps14F family polysaccharide biosynthesis glycosyltransferase n=1 Tax=Thermococcus sp. TaxID=35749 RepID=UPI001D272C5E|nr:PssD/Cps14F family polysaccharide biosynthesis glycosyltransferase [Thermococcus sp.]MBO8175037.1 hypothetical protein [Thermococcus sp.]
MKIALVCSHGGHLTEMLYLIDAFKGHEVFFITYDHPRTRALKYKKYLFPNFGRNPIRIIIDLPKIAKVLAKEKPDIIVSNGAEIAIPFFYLGRIIGAKTVFIECYTRIYRPTITGKIVYPVSNYFIVLWSEMLSKYGKKARYFGGLFKKWKAKMNLQEKKNQIFIITGTHYLGFERLVKAVDKIAKDFSYRFLIQLGYTPYRPKNAEYFTFIKEDKEIKKLMKSSKVVITQGAMSLIDALMNGSTAIAFPRLSTFGEHINDHQLTFSKKLEKEGLVRVATDENSLKKILADLLTTPKVKWRESVVVNRRLINILREVISDE